MLFPLYSDGSVADALVDGMAGGGANKWPFPEKRALSVFFGVCDGVRALHAAGLAHRDIKPHNILLDFKRPGPDGGPTAVLMDFGSCHSCARREIQTHQEAMLLKDEAAMHCTAPYRAPELHDPHRGSVLDGRVDVFSLGCVLFMMAFGNNPFEPNGEFARLALLNGKYKVPAGGRS